MFERYTEKSIKVIMLAQEESRRMGHSYVGTEHLLLGLIGEREGVAISILERLNIDLADVRNRVIQMLSESAASGCVTRDTEAATWEEDDRSLEDEDFGAARRRAHRQERDPLAAAETKMMLRSILDRTIAIERSMNEMSAEIVTLTARVAAIEGKLSP
jgi:ATP-dependent Clp protease ATP-binding subunit ClpA